MSQENVELVRELFEAGYRRDRATVFGLYDAEVVWDVSRLGVADFGAGVYHGHEGLRDWFREWYSAWEETRNQLEELTDAGESVVSVHTQRGRGQASGVEVELEQYAVWTIRVDKVVSAVWFLTREEAFEFASLGEQAESRPNVDAVRAVYEQWAKGDFRTAEDLWDSRVVFVPVADLPDAGEYFGREGIASFMRAFLQPWTNFTITAEEFIEAGDSVVVVARQRGVGRVSGLVADMEQQFQVWTFRGRSVIRFEAFRDRASVLEAVGLVE